MSEKKTEPRIEPLMASVPEAYRALGISRSSFYREIKEGRIKPVKAGKRTLIPVRELHEWPKRLATAS